MARVEGYWEVELGNSTTDPDMVRATLKCYEEVEYVLRKYILENLRHVVVRKVPFTDINRI